MDIQVAAPQAPAQNLPLPLRVLPDERLARLVGSGNESAFATLYGRYHQTLYRYCRSLVGSDVDAQDALQSALTGALVALRAGRRDAPVRPWLFRIAHNECISLLRRRRPDHELPQELPGRDRSAHEVLEERTRLALLVGDLRELPERQRGALVMRELSGLSHEDVALALDMSVGAAKQTVFEARRALLEFAEGRAMACEDIRRTVSDGDRRALRGRRIRAHLRECGGCAAFAEAIPARRSDLLALSPALPAVAATGLLARITGLGSSHGTSGAGLVAGAGSKAVTAGISGKLLATGVAIVATATVGTSGVLHALHSGAAPAPAVTHSHSGATGAGEGSSASHVAAPAASRHARSGQHAHRLLASPAGRATGESHRSGSAAHAGGRHDQVHAEGIAQSRRRGQAQRGLARGMVHHQNTARGRTVATGSKHASRSRAAAHRHHPVRPATTGKRSTQTGVLGGSGSAATTPSTGTAGGSAASAAAVSSPASASSARGSSKMTTTSSG